MFRFIISIIAFVISAIISGMLGSAIILAGFIGVILVNLLLSSYDIKTDIVEIREILISLKDKENNVKENNVDS